MPVDLDLLKQTFYRNVIELRLYNLPGDPVVAKRFVALVDNWGEDSRGPSDCVVRIFEPQSWDDDYDLVLSLATDGQTYPTYDLDYVSAREAAVDNNLIIVPSTGNWHGYGTQPLAYADMMAQMTGGGRYENEGYWAMNSHKGWCGLRPPWITKGGFDPRVEADMFTNYNWTPVMDVPPPPPPGISLADLFDEDES